MEILNLTNRKVIIEVPGWSSIIIPPTQGGELLDEPKEDVMYIVPPDVKDENPNRKDVLTPKGMTTTTDSCPRYAGCWYI